MNHLCDECSNTETTNSLLIKKRLGENPNADIDDLIMKPFINMCPVCSFTLLNAVNVVRKQVEDSMDL